VAFDVERDAVVLSPILKWFAEDWQDHGGVLEWLGERVESAAFQAALRRKAKAPASVVYAEHDRTHRKRTSDRVRSLTTDAISTMKLMRSSP